MTHNSPPKSIALHIGAHKTATTHLQRSLLASEAALATHKARYFGPDKLRGQGQGLIDRFGLRVEGAKAANRSSLAPSDQLAAMAEGADRLVLSDENFIGNLQTKTGNMSMPLYPRANERVAALADAADLGAIDVFLGLRGPADFLTSAYSQLLMGGDAIAFAEYLAQNPMRSIYWPGLVARLVSLPQIGRLFVWRQEDYAGVFPQICSHLIGSPLPIRPLAGMAHRGLSAQAVDVALDTFARTGERGAGKSARDVYPVNQIYPAFAPFDDQTIAQSAAEYETQIADIAKLPRVTVLRT